MVKKKTWEEFRNTGMLWFINMILHAFGWSIVYLLNEDDEFIDVYPARVKFRGFDEKSNTEGYIKISQFLKDNSNALYEEAKA